MPPLSGPNFADTKLLDQRAVAGNILGSQISFKASALTDQDHEATSRVEVLFVLLQVLRDLLDPCMHDCNLDFCRSRISLAPRIVRDRLTLDVLI